MSGLLIDSTNPNAIIEAVRAKFKLRDMAIRGAALYADGEWPAPPAAFSMLHRLGIKTADITVTGNPAIKAAKIASDVEPGNLTPGAAAKWAEEERHAGEWPVLYVNRENKAETISACLALSLTPAKDFGLWVATLDSTFTDTGGADLRHEPGVVAVQAYGAKSIGIDADASVLTALGDNWLGLPPTWQAEALALARDLADLLGKHA
jgi:hypothetical protein